MKKIISLTLIITIVCITLTGCSNLRGGIDLNNDGNDDVRVDSFVSPIYTISFNTNGGKPVASKKLVTLDTPPKTTRTGYTFMGWYRDESLLIPAVYPLNIDSNITLYAKWLQIYNKAICRSVSLKFMNDRGGSATYDITPNSFDLNTLSAEGYSINISVSYSVCYQKDYDVLWDIGYMGAPKYEVSIFNSDMLGNIEKDNTTTKSKKTHTFNYETTAATCKNSSLYLTFSTDNIQNIIFFDDIVVEYYCTK